MDQEDLIFKSKMAEKTERFDDMRENVRALVELKRVLDSEEQRLFVVAYKNCVGSKRHVWRQLKLSEVGLDKIVFEYKQTIENEIRATCAEVMVMLNSYLIPCSTDVKSRVEYLKLKGDFYRYLAEISENEERKECAENGALFYKEASEIATSEMSPVDPGRLGLALNFSVFFYDILEKPERACQIAMAAFNDALMHLDNTTEQNYSEVTTTMQLLRDNLTLWSADFTV